MSCVPSGRWEGARHPEGRNQPRGRHGGTASEIYSAEKESVTAEFASLERAINERKKRIDAALAGARINAEQAKIAVEAAQGQLTMAKTDHATVHGRLVELRKQRDAENLAAAETRLQGATEHHAALPVPDRIVTDDELSAAQTTAAGMKLDLERIERDRRRSGSVRLQFGSGCSHEQWARFRFSVIGPLLAAPPARGDLQEQLKSLAANFACLMAWLD